ncbi:MAG: EamA family transporter, partial [Betaproteobacteria bacterium]
VLGHKISERGASGGVERLGAAMAIAFLFIIPIGFVQALKAFGAVELVLAGIGVGVCSSVIPYVCDQLAMSRLPRTSFALMLALLPATATIIGAIILAQIPSVRDVTGVLLVMLGIAIHKPAALEASR